MAFKKAVSTPEIEPVTESSEDAGKRELHEQAVHHVKNQHGTFVHRLDNYNDLVTDAKNQISKAIEDNKTF